MAKKIKKYAVMAGEGANPKKRRVVKTFLKKSEAKAYLRKLLAPGKMNPGGFRQTAYRDAISGVGISNPRIKTYMGFK